MYALENLEFSERSAMLVFCVTSMWQSCDSTGVMPSATFWH